MLIVQGLLLFGRDDVVWGANEVLQQAGIRVANAAERSELGHAQMILEQADALVCDLDGVVYRGDQPIDGVPEAIERLRARGKRLLFCTNNSRSTVAQYLDKLAGMAIHLDERELLTSAVVAGEVIESMALTGGRALVVGGEGIRGAVEAAGLTILDDHDETSVDLVAVGWDPLFDYSAMRQAAIAVRGGAVFLATNDDASFPAEDALWPGAGAILASIEVASGRHARVVGKPHKAMMDAAARRLDGAKTIAVVGDRPETDLKGGWERGWPTVLVLSGVTSRSDVVALRVQPDAIADSLADAV